jgi:excisionase family DNA binding protein
MARKKESKMLTVREVASEMGRTEQTIRTWLKKGRFPGAHLEETPLGSYWLIPDTAVKEFELKKAGRPPKKKESSIVN